MYRGAGWNVIKVVWGGDWDALLAQDHDGRLRRRMMECVDGEYQVFAGAAAPMREHFFGADPVLLERVAHLSDEQIGALHRGGHDPAKVYAAYARALRHTGRPTVILAKTVKGYGMGAAGEAANTNHQQKKMADPGRARVPRPLLHPGARRSAGADSVHRRRPAAPSRPISTRPSSARRPSAAPSGRPRPAGHAAAGGLRLVAQEQRGREFSTTLASCGCWASC